MRNVFLPRLKIRDACKLAGLAVFFLAAGPALPARAANTDPVKVGCVEFPPITFTNAAGTPGGTGIALLHAVLSRAGLSWQTDKCLPGARLMANLRDGSAHVAILIHHPDIAQDVLYGRLPVAYLNLDGYRLVGTAPLGGIGNLRGKRVILLRGYGYGGWIDFFKDPANGMHLSYADSHRAALRMLASGHGDYLVDYREPARQALEEEAWPDMRQEGLARLEAYFLVSKKAPGAEALLQRMEDAFHQMGARPID